MSKGIIDISMSLDGFVNAANMSPEEPLGDGGQRLHDWAFGSEDPRNGEMLAKAWDVGALIAGRRTYDTSLPGWGADGPTGAARVPTIVVSHDVPAQVPDGGVYTFVTEGIERALREAKKTAGDKDVGIMGGADIAQQYIRAGLVDEISIHLVPVLFGGGMRLFEHLGSDHVHLEHAGVIETPEATHLRFRVMGRSR